MNDRQSSPTAYQPEIATGPRFLIEGQRACGGWSYRADLSECALEPTLWSLLALSACGRLDPDIAKRGLDFILRSQRANGGFARSPDPSVTSDWHTYPAILCLRKLFDEQDAVQRAVDWTLTFHAKHWDNPDPANLGHDTSLKGWSWVAGTHAWSEPTAYALMALEACGHADHPRSVEARAMLIDRAIVGGGWNYGNKMVLGTNLRPFPGTTGIVLTALRHLPNEPVIHAGVRYLRQQLATVRSAMSLSWTVIALKLLAPETFDAAMRAKVEAATDAALTHTIETSGNALHVALVLLATQHPDRWPMESKMARRDAEPTDPRLIGATA